MKDSTTVEAIKITSKPDTITLHVDRKLLGYSDCKKQVDTIQILAIVLPFVATILTLLITRWFDNISENKRFKREIQKENRTNKIKILKNLNDLKTSLHKPRFPNQELEDFYERTADKMTDDANPFHDLQVYSNILFNRDVINIANDLYYTAEKIKSNYKWKSKEHPSESITLGGKILEDLNSIIDKISQNISNE